jgi:GNAT superfamily N-acetyltransferase
MAVIIRRARPADASAIARIHAESWRETYEEVLPESYLDRLGSPRLEARWRERLMVPGECARLRIAEEGGRVIGFAQLGPANGDPAIAGFAGEVSMLYVTPGATGRGVGTLLLERTFEVLADHGFHWVVIWVVSRNLRARDFYERHGMQPDGAARWDRFDGHGVFVVRLAKPLNPAIDFDDLDRALGVRSPALPDPE